MQVPLRAVVSLLFVCCSAAVLFSGCASGGGSPDRIGRTTTTAGKVTFRDLVRGNSITLISESMLARMGFEGDTPDERTKNFYSTRRGDATTKVCRDDVITGLVQYFDENYERWAIAGEAPLDSSETEKTIEVVVDGTARWMLDPEGTQADPNQRTAFFDYVKLVLAAYSNIPQYQAVEGITEFKKPELSERQKRASRGLDSGGILDGGIR